jgi:predicted kinase
MPFLVLLRGAPGSGKSTIARALSGSGSGFVHYETDQYFMRDGLYAFDHTKLREAHRWCQNVVWQEMCKGDRNVVVSNTFTRLWEIDPYLGDAKANGYDALIYRCVGERASVHDVPADKVQRMRDGYEPHPEEMRLVHPAAL